MRFALIQCVALCFMLAGCSGFFVGFVSNPGGMKSRAVRERGGWRISGTKRWITNGSIADVAIVWAKTEGDDAKSIRGFLVERDTPGFSAPTASRTNIR